MRGGSTEPARIVGVNFFEVWLLISLIWYATYRKIWVLGRVRGRKNLGKPRRNFQLCLQNSNFFIFLGINFEENHSYQKCKSDLLRMIQFWQLSFIEKQNFHSLAKFNVTIWFQSRHLRTCIYPLVQHQRKVYPYIFINLSDIHRYFQLLSEKMTGVWIAENHLESSAG